MPSTGASAPNLPQAAPQNGADQACDQVPASLPLPRFAALRPIVALLLREMTTTYGRNPGGYIWAFIQPIGGIVVLTIAFALVMHKPPLGTSFALFYATGFLPFDVFHSLQGAAQSALQASRPLLAYPRVVWLDAILARVLLSVLTNIIVMIAIWSGIVFFSGTTVILNLSAIADGFLMMALLGVGIGMINSLLIGLYPMWKTIWGIVNRPLFLASGIFFLYEDMPRLAQDILWWNPLIHAIARIREGFYSTYHADYVSHIYVYGLSLSLVLIGLMTLRAWHKKVLEF